MSSQLDQVLATDQQTLTAVQATSAQLTTDVDNLISLIQNGDPGALTAAQAIGSSLTALNTSLQSLDTSAQGAGGINAQTQIAGQTAGSSVTGAPGGTATTPTVTIDPAGTGTGSGTAASATPPGVINPPAGAGNESTGAGGVTVTSPGTTSTQSAPGTP